MKVIILIWSIIQLILFIVGFVWVFIERKNEPRKKAPYILLAIASFMTAFFFLVFMPRMIQ